MKVELEGRTVLVGGAEGALTSAIRQELPAHGAHVAGLDLAPGAQQAARKDPAAAAPHAVILVSEGANGLPAADTASQDEGRRFARAIRQYAPGLKRAVIVYSSAGLVPVNGYSEFSAAQAGIATLVRTLAMELGPFVAVNGVSVGAYEADGDLRTARFLTHTGIKRAATPEEIVAAVLFLVDPDNGYMTGHTLNVDGGWAAGYARNF